MEERTLSDADIEAITKALEKRLTDKFYKDLGQGLWGLVWKVVLGFIIFVAAQGMYGKAPWKGWF